MFPNKRFATQNKQMYGCKVKITYAEDGDSMEVLQKLIHDTLCKEAKNCS